MMATQRELLRELLRRVGEQNSDTTPSTCALLEALDNWADLPAEIAAEAKATIERLRTWVEITGVVL